MGFDWRFKPFMCLLFSRLKISSALTAVCGRAASVPWGRLLSLGYKRVLAGKDECENPEASPSS